jgi:hypothetical protein
LVSVPAVAFGDVVVSANADVSPPTVSARVAAATVRIFAFWNM